MSDFVTKYMSELTLKETLDGSEEFALPSGEKTTSQQIANLAPLPEVDTGLSINEAKVISVDTEVMATREFANTKVSLSELKEYADYVPPPIDASKLHTNVDAGQYIVGTDGYWEYCYTEAEWANRGDSVMLLGVAVISADGSFIIASSDAARGQWGNESECVRWVESGIRLGADGVENTSNIIDFYGDGSSAALTARTYEWSGISKSGYLASSSEWEVVYEHLSDIQSLLEEVGGEILSNGSGSSMYWTSNGGGMTEENPSDSSLLADCVDLGMSDYYDRHQEDTTGSFKGIRPFARFNEIGDIPEGLKLATQDYVDKKVTSSTGGESGAYDKVIKTQAEFEELLSSSTWMGAKNILLNGSFTASEAIFVPDTVESIVGINNCTITVTISQSATNTVAIHRTERDRSLFINGSISDITVVTNALGGLQYCNNLSRVLVQLTASTLTTGFGIRAGLRDCIGLDGCRTEILGDSDLTTYGMMGCWDLSGCYVEVSEDTTLATKLGGYYQCQLITNSNATISSTLLIKGFDSCKKLSNCAALVTCSGVKTAYGYKDCEAITSSVSRAEGSTGYGYYECDSIAGCVDSGSTTEVYYNCTNVATSYEPEDSGTNNAICPYDKVIKTQSEFEALIATNDWCGATSVAFVGDGGDLVFTTSTPLVIPSGVMSITGYNAAHISVSITTTEGGMSAISRAENGEFVARTISISTYNDIQSGGTGSGSGGGTSYGINIPVFCADDCTLDLQASKGKFYSIKGSIRRLNNVTVTAKSLSNGTHDGWTGAESGCDITGCKITTYGGGGDNFYISAANSGGGVITNNIISCPTLYSIDISYFDVVVGLYVVLDGPGDENRTIYTSSCGYVNSATVVVIS